MDIIDIIYKWIEQILCVDALRTFPHSDSGAVFIQMARAHNRGDDVHFNGFSKFKGFSKIHFICSLYSCILGGCVCVGID